MGTRDAAAEPERRHIIDELQRLRTQKDKLREQLAERERFVQLKEDQTADAFVEEAAASPGPNVTGMCSSWPPKILPTLLIYNVHHVCPDVLLVNSTHDRILGGQP